MKKLLTFLSLLFFAISCADDDLDYNQSIEGTWVLNYLIDRPELNLMSSLPTLKIESPAGFSGKAICNTYSGLIENITADEINLGYVFSTEIFCGNTLNMEFSYFDMMNYVSYYEITLDDKLILFDTHYHVLMEFDRT